MRYAAFYVWFAVTVVSAMFALSEYAFDNKTDPKKSAKLFAKRFVLSLVWPLALMSPRGRALLLKNSKEYV